MTSIDCVKVECAGKLLDSQIAINDQYFVFAFNEFLMLNCLDFKLVENVKLAGHYSTVSTVCINSTSGGTLLASSGSHCIIIWDVEELMKCHTGDYQLSGTILDKVCEVPCSLSLSKDNKELCVVTSGEVYIISTKKKSVEFRMKCTYCTRAFFSSDSSVVCAMDTGEMQIWDTTNSRCVWTAPYIGGGISSLSLSLNEGGFLFGSANGVIQRFVKDVDSGRKYRYKKQFEVNLTMEVFRQQNAQAKAEQISVMPNAQVIAVFIATLSNEFYDSSNEVSQKLFCATNQILFIVNSENQEVEILPFNNMGLPLLAAIKFCQYDRTTVFGISSSLYENCIHIIKYNLETDSDSGVTSVSALPRAPLNQKSILKMPLKQPKPKQSKIPDRPITFRSTVKSSGYNTAGRGDMFKPHTNNTKPNTVNNHEANGHKFCLHPDYVCTDWKKNLSVERRMALSPTHNINHVSVSGNNQLVAASLSNHSVVILKKMSHKTTITGHDGSVFGCNFSNSVRLAVTHSADCTAKVWMLSSTDKPVFNLTNSNESTEANDKKIAKEISHSQFYFVDKFILVATGNCFRLYNYFIDDSPKCDIKRYLDNSIASVVKSFYLDKAHSISSMSAPNNIYSYIVLACGSDRRLEVYDMNVGKVVGSIVDTHKRPVTKVLLSTGSSHLPSWNYDMFTTVASSDGIKLWDLRTLKCIRKLNSHPLSCTSTIDTSPCGNYIATNGDDRRLHIYDVRNSLLLQSSLQQPDKISSIAFNMDSSQIYAGLQNGALLRFACV